MKSNKRLWGDILTESEDAVGYLKKILKPAMEQC
jgi:hypothetical protein